MESFCNVVSAHFNIKQYFSVCVTHSSVIIPANSVTNKCVSLVDGQTSGPPSQRTRLTQQVYCCELAVAAAVRRQLNDTSAQCDGTFSKRHRHGTDRRTADRCNT